MGFGVSGLWAEGLGVRVCREVFPVGSSSGIGFGHLRCNGMWEYPQARDDKRMSGNNRCIVP